MICPVCNSGFEIFSRSGKEIYVCPQCFSCLAMTRDSLSIAKFFCKEEILAPLLTNIIDDSAFIDTKERLKPRDDCACPGCQSYMSSCDFEGRIKFGVNQCISCGAVWMNSLQLPLVAIAFTDPDNKEDQGFKKGVESMYNMIASKRRISAGSIDDILAAYITIPLALMGNAIPVSDNTLTRSKFYGTKTIIGLSVLVYLAQFSNSSLVQDFSVIAERVVNGGQIYRLLTAALLHGSILHIAGNMWYLWVFGRSVEDRIGWKMYAAFYCIAAVVSSALYVATTTNKTMPCIGASGAISGIIGAYLIFFPHTKLKFKFLYSMHQPVFAPAWAYILGWILLNFFFGMLQAGSGTRGVAYWGHIGGFVAGIISAHLYQSVRQK